LASTCAIESLRLAERVASLHCVGVRLIVGRERLFCAAELVQRVRAIREQDRRNRCVALRALRDRERAIEYLEPAFVVAHRTAHETPVVVKLARFAAFLPSELGHALVCQLIVPLGVAGPADEVIRIRQVAQQRRFQSAVRQIRRLQAL
jgi:hypothetical protein